MSQDPSQNSIDAVDHGAELRNRWLERLRTRDAHAVNLALAWAGSTTTRLHGRLRVDQGPPTSAAPSTEAPLPERMRAIDEAWFAPSKVGLFLGLFPEELAERLGVEVRQLDEWPPTAEIQGSLAAIVDVLARALEVYEDEDQAVAWYLGTPMEEFGSRTADEMLRSGESDAVLELLAAKKAGFR